MTITAIVRAGRLELPRPLDLPDGTEVTVYLPGERDADGGMSGAEWLAQPPAVDLPPTPEDIADALAAMDRVEPFVMTDEEYARWQADLAAQKAWEKAHFFEHADGLKRTLG